MSNFLNDLDISHVPACVPRIKRIISPAQDGLLDAASHFDADAPKLVEALNWMQCLVADNTTGELTNEDADKLRRIHNLTQWINDVVLEKQGLVEYDDKVIRFEDVPEDD